MYDRMGGLHRKWVFSSQSWWPHVRMLVKWVPSALTGLEWQVFKSSCLPRKFRDEWSFGGLTYQVSGDPDGKILFISSVATGAEQYIKKCIVIATLTCAVMISQTRRPSNVIRWGTWCLRTLWVIKLCSFQVGAKITSQSFKFSWYRAALVATMLSQRNPELLWGRLWRIPVCYKRPERDVQNTELNSLSYPQKHLL